MSDPVASASTVAAASAPASGLAFAQALPLRREHDSSFDAPGLGLVNAFVVVAIVAAYALWLLRRRAVGAGMPAGAGGATPPIGLQRLFGASAGGLRVLQSTRLTGHSSAHVLAWKGGEWLVVCTDQSATVVSHAPAGEPGSAPAAGDVS